MQRVPSIRDLSGNNNLEYSNNENVNTEHYNENDLISQPYFLNEITAEEAEALLKDKLKKEGCFLVRKRFDKDDSDVKPYAISTYYDSAVHHYRIKKYENGKYSIDTHDKRPTMFDSVPEIIKFFDERNTYRCKLTTKYNNLIEQFKIYPKEPENVDLAADDESLDDLPYYLGAICREETAKILTQIKQNETFFIRKTSKKSAPYELSVYFKTNIYDLDITRTPYDAYSIQNSELTFETIPDLVRHYNYEKLRINSEVSVRLQIHSRYIKK